MKMVRGKSGRLEPELKPIDRPYRIEVSLEKENVEIKFIPGDTAFGFTLNMNEATELYEKLKRLVT